MNACDAGPISGGAARSERVFLAIVAAFFGTTALLTVLWCRAMSDMGAMPMPGGWAMSMTWMRMPGQSWFDAAASFIGMWALMMIAMMLPSLVPLLRRYRRSVSATGEQQLAWLCVATSAGYFAVWSAWGLLAYVLGTLLATLAMQSTALCLAVPTLVGAAVVMAGALQFTSWKQRQLVCCRTEPYSAPRLQPDVRNAWRHGVRLGLRCSACCANLMVILLVMGVMEIGTMMLITIAISVERLASAGERITRLTGLIAMAAGLELVVRASGL